MCTSEVNGLQAFNVHNTKDTDEFQLHLADFFAACQNAGPNIFCLLPPTVRLEQMCTPVLSAYFQDVLDGTEATSLDNLPIVWDSLQETSSDQWIDTPQSSQFIDQSTGLYYGLQPLPDFFDLAASSDAQILFGVALGTCYTTNDQTGFVEAHLEINGTNDVFQRVTVNTLGTIAAILFSNALYFWQNGIFITMTEVGMQYVNAIITETAPDVVRVSVVHRTQDTCFVSRYTSTAGSAITTLTSRLSLSLSPADVVLWSVVAPDDGSTLFVAIDNPANLPSGYTVYVVNATNFLAVWTNVPRSPSGVLQPGAWQAVCRETSSDFAVTAVNNNVAIVQHILLSKTTTAASISSVNGIVIRIKESITRDFFAFSSSDATNGFYVNVGSTDNITFTAINGLSVDFVSPFCFAANGTNMWYMSRATRQLFRNDNSVNQFGTLFTNDFDLNQNTLAHVSDYGLPTIVEQPMTTWFFGYEIHPRVQIGGVYPSPHQYYRILIENEVVVNQRQFPHVNTHLQRANFLALLQTNSVQLFDNSQTKILQSSDDRVLWQRNTNDTWGSNSNFASSAQTLTTLVSPNGLYILYVAPAGPRVVVNVFNSGAFQEYCSVSKERLSRALERQSAFCWNYLYYPDQRTETNINELFSDKRCVCIGGPRLMTLLYPQLENDPNSLLPANTSLARVGQNFQCVSRTCQEAIADPELTNVYVSVQDRCQNASLTVCSSLVEKTGSSSAFLKIGQGLISQNCGNLLHPCGQDGDCPLGSVCVNGNCVTNCSSSADCVFGSSCENGVCINAQQQTASQQQSSANIATAVLIVFSIFAALALLALLLILLLKKKST